VIETLKGNIEWSDYDFFTGTAALQLNVRCIPTRNGEPKQLLLKYFNISAERAGGNAHCRGWPVLTELEWWVTVAALIHPNQ
jgi:hypothetical protein